ncbi:MAG: cell division control protein 6 [Thermoplasmata archaeon]|nr:cell division control protein 6 [Thermoplasmata archaeon]
MFESSGRIIRDGAPLDFKYVPDELIGRKEQTDQLEASFRPLFFSNTPCSAYIYGPVGSGKTVTVMKFSSDMEKAFSKAGKKLDVITVNCRIRNGEYPVLLDLVRYFDRGFPDRGFSSEEMFVSFRRHVSDGCHPVLVILDEADVLLSSPGRDIIYQMTRMDGLKEGASLSLMMISQKPLTALSLDQASLSTFGRDSSVSFNGYSRGDLRAIAEQRARLALYPGAIDDGCLDLIANAAEPYGDARFALEMLEKAANLAETKGDTAIRAEYLQKASGEVHSDYSEAKMEDLDIGKLLILLSVARSLFKNDTVTINHAEGTYAAACEEFGVPARKHTQFYTNVKTLSSMGFIHLEVRNEPGGGRTSILSLTSIPARDLAGLVEDLISKRIKGGADYEV